MSADPAGFAVELGRALTGESLPLTSPLADDLAAELADLGWGPEQLAELRRRRQRQGLPWPLPVRRDVVASIGFAVFYARLQTVRERLGLTGLEPRPLAQRPLDDAERRLCAGRPPHWA